MLCVMCCIHSGTCLIIASYHFTCQTVRDSLFLRFCTVRDSTFVCIYRVQASALALSMGCEGQPLLHVNQRGTGRPRAEESTKVRPCSIITGPNGQPLPVAESQRSALALRPSPQGSDNKPLLGVFQSTKVSPCSDWSVMPLQLHVHQAPWPGMCVLCCMLCTCGTWPGPCSPVIV